MWAYHWLAFLNRPVLNRKLEWQSRLKDLIIFLAIVFLPTLAWLVRNWLVSESLTNRVLDWHPITSENISLLMKTVNSWGCCHSACVRNLGFFRNYPMPYPCGFVLANMFVAPSLVNPLAGIYLIISGLMYVAFNHLLVFLGCDYRLENRILLPLYIIILLLVVIGSDLLWQYKTILTRVGAVLICIWLAYFSFTRVDGAIMDLRSDGQGYASLKWQNSPTAGFIRLQDTSVIFTNDVTAIYFLSGKDSVGIPNSSATESDFSQMREGLRTPNSYLVIFGTLTGEFAPLDKLTQDLTLVDSFADGRVYQLR
jgi:hypothetical protein